MVVRYRGLYTRLLEHDLRDPYPIRLPVHSPGKIAPLGIVMLQEESSDSVKVELVRDSPIPPAR